MNLTHKTTENELKDLSRDELKDLMVEHGIQPKSANSMNKLQRVGYLMTIVERMKEIEATIEGAIAEARQEQLEKDKSNKLYRAILESMHGEMEGRIADWEKQLNDIHTKICDQHVHAMASTMVNSIETVMYTNALLREIKGIAGYVNGQMTDPTVTVDEFVAEMENWASRAADQCFESTEYQHRCTNAITNTEGENKFKAAQMMARYSRAMVAAIKEDLNGSRIGMLRTGSIYVW